MKQKHAQSKKTPGRAELLRTKGTTEGVRVCMGHLIMQSITNYPIIKVIDIFYSEGILYVKNYLKHLTGLSLSDGELLCMSGAGAGRSNTTQGTRRQNQPQASACYFFSPVSFDKSF